jgi:hypothetical protein
MQQQMSAKTPKYRPETNLKEKKGETALALGETDCAGNNVVV